MPVDTFVLPQLNLAVFVYSGPVTFQEASEAVAGVAQHPDHHDTMNQLCDLSGVTAVERDFAELMKMQASLTEHLLPQSGEKLVVFCAPHAAARSMANMARKSWDGFNQVLVRLVEREDQAMALLGLKQNSIAELTRLQAKV